MILGEDTSLPHEEVHDALLASCRCRAEAPEGERGSEVTFEE
jgi:hypothetical protein